MWISSCRIIKVSLLNTLTRQSPIRPDQKVLLPSEVPPAVLVSLCLLSLRICLSSLYSLPRLLQCRGVMCEGASVRLCVNMERGRVPRRVSCTDGNHRLAASKLQAVMRHRFLSLGIRRLFACGCHADADVWDEVYTQLCVCVCVCVSVSVSVCLIKCTWAQHHRRRCRKAKAKGMR